MDVVDEDSEIEFDSLEEWFNREMEWMYEANGTSPSSDSTDNVISLAQIAAIPQSNSSGEAYGYAASFTIGAIAATVYLYYANNKERSCLIEETFSHTY